MERSSQHVVKNAGFCVAVAWSLVSKECASPSTKKFALAILCMDISHLRAIDEANFVNSDKFA